MKKVIIIYGRILVNEMYKNHIWLNFINTGYGDVYNTHHNISNNREV